MTANVEPPKETERQIGDNMVKGFILGALETIIAFPAIVFIGVCRTFSKIVRHYTDDL